MKREPTWRDRLKEDLRDLWHLTLALLGLLAFVALLLGWLPLLLSE